MDASEIDDFLLEVLQDADLERFAQSLAEKLQVTKLDHFSHVKDSDLSSIGLSQPAIKRLKAGVKDKKNALKRQQQKGTLSKRKGSKLSPTSTLRSGSSGDAPEESGNVTCLISRDDIKLLETLGEGSFGIVKRANWRRAIGKKMDVAVKLLQTSGELSDDTLQEINAMHALRHPNLIRLFGVVLSAPIMMVMEICEGGALLDRLRSTNLPVVLIDQLIDYGVQIAMGMAYLESKHFIHRDLAARNVLLSLDEKVVKIGDFGLMRALPNREEHYVMSGQKKVPFAWCPPESLKFKQFSYASDVWAFGVTLWEMFSFGEEPWCGLNGAEILQKVTAGERLPEPDACPSSIFQLVKQCWALESTQRPTFAALKELLNESVLTVGKCKEAQTGEGLLELDVGDRVIVIDGNVDNYYWYGQNIRTHKLGKFARKHVVLEEVTGPKRQEPERKGSSVFFEVAVGGLTSNNISRPIRGSFVHTGHGDARGGESWGCPDKIDPIFLQNPLWIPPSTKKSETDRRKAASISCADDQQALVFDDDLTSRHNNLSDDERRLTSNEARVRLNDEFQSRRNNDHFNTASSRLVNEARYNSSSNTSGGESSSVGSSSGFVDGSAAAAATPAVASMPTMSSSRPYYSIVPPPPCEARRVYQTPPTVEVEPPTPTPVQRLYDQVAGADDPFEVPVEVKTLTNRQRYSDLYATVSGSVPPLPPPPSAEYARILKKQSWQERVQPQQPSHQPPRDLRFINSIPTAIAEMKPPQPNQGRSMSTSAISSSSPLGSPSKPPGPFPNSSLISGSRPTAIARPFFQQPTAGSGSSTVSTQFGHIGSATAGPSHFGQINTAAFAPFNFGQFAPAPSTRLAHFDLETLRQQPERNNILMDELTRKLQSTNYGHSNTYNPNGLSFSANGYADQTFTLPSPSGFVWNGPAMSANGRTQSVPDVSVAVNTTTAGKVANVDTHQILDLFDPLTSRPQDDLVQKVRAQAPFAQGDRCAIMLKRCLMDVQRAVAELKTEKLVDMGLADRTKCIRALETNDWDVNAAAEKLLGQATTKMDIESVIDEQTDLQDLKKFEKIYNEELSKGTLTPKATFEYAFCLVRSNKNNVRLGVQLLEDLLANPDPDEAKRDYLYYLSVGYVKLAKYDLALKYVEALLRVEPTNHQAINLRDLIKKRMKKDAAVGAALLGGAAAVGGALLVGAIAVAAALRK